MTSRVPPVALAAIVKVALIWVSPAKVTSFTESPVPLTATTAPALKFVPVRVTVLDVPAKPVAGLIQVNVPMELAGVCGGLMCSCNCQPGFVPSPA